MCVGLKLAYWLKHLPVFMMAWGLQAELVHLSPCFVRNGPSLFMVSKESKLHRSQCQCVSHCGGFICLFILGEFFQGGRQKASSTYAKCCTVLHFHLVTTKSCSCPAVFTWLCNICFFFVSYLPLPSSNWLSSELTLTGCHQSFLSLPLLSWTEETQKLQSSQNSLC